MWKISSAPRGKAQLSATYGSSRQKRVSSTFRADIVESLELVLQEFSFFDNLSSAHVKLLITGAQKTEFPEQHYIFREGELANYFYAICDGLVSVELFVPERGATRIETVDKGEVLGWSWTVPPYRWRFDARTLRPTHALAFNAHSLRAKFEEDHDFGYEMMKHFTDVIIARLDAARLQLLDLYGGHS